VIFAIEPKYRTSRLPPMTDFQRFEKFQNARVRPASPTVSNDLNGAERWNVEKGLGGEMIEA
jgi:hypothetical protein